MTEFSSETWLLMGAIAGLGTVTILHTLARTFGEEQKLHDLTHRVFDLRRSYSRRLAELGRDGTADHDGIIEAIPVDEPSSHARHAA